tara:strand:- start:1424 stop:1900 length:477 start_codon:yes stop_codon:yes gene_type:complete
MRKHHPRLEMQTIRSRSGERISEGWANFNPDGRRWGFHMMIPRSAPEDGRPLCTKVSISGKLAWEFETDHKMFRGIKQKVRVHLHEFHFGKSVQFVLVEVIEGDPDRISRVFKMDGNEFSFEVEVLMKSQVARLWGMKVRTTAEEKRALERLTAPKKK